MLSLEANELCSTKARVVAQRPEIQLRREAGMLPQMLGGESRMTAE